MFSKIARVLLITVLSSALFVTLLPVTSRSSQPDPFGPEPKPLTPLTPPEEFIGATLGDHGFTDQDGNSFTLKELSGKPFIISFIYTECQHTCPLITSRLVSALEKAPKELAGGFHVLTIGIDTENDTPSSMRQYGLRFTEDFEQWRFLSADAPTIERITGELGFFYEKTEYGFAHANMVTVVDTEGRIYKHVYGQTFKSGDLIGPLKEIAGIKPKGAVSKWEYTSNLSFFGKVKLLCSRYNPSTGAYEIYYPYFIAMAFQLLAIVATVLIVWGKNLNSALTRTVRAFGIGG